MPTPWVDPLVRVELVKLAHELGAPERELDFLAPLGPSRLAVLRRQIGHALFDRHEHRFHRMARAAAYVPPTLGGLGARRVLPPLLAARGAAVMEPRVALRLVKHLGADYLVRLVPNLDPEKVTGIVAGLPDHQVIELGELLVARREYISLGRFVSQFPVGTTLRLVQVATPLDLVRVALFTEDHEAIGRALDRLPEERVAAMLSAAAESGEADDAVAMVLAILPGWTRPRVLQIAAQLPEQVRAQLADAVLRVPPGASVPDPDTPPARQLLEALAR